MEKIYNNLIKNSNKVRGCMQDDLSREIYDCKVLNTLTYDYKYITSITKDKIDVFEELKRQLEQYKNKCDIVIDGAGYYGKSIKATMTDVEWTCVCDRTVSDTEWWNIPYMSRADAVKRYPDALYVVSSMLYGLAIEKELKQLGVKNIINFGRYISKYGEVNPKQYYDVFKFSNDEVIVDAGCFDCQSTMQYFKYGNERYKKIYSFEPEPEQYIKCKNIIEQEHYSNWEIFNYGACDSNGKLYFNSNSSCSKISNEGDIAVDVIKLDDFFKTHEEPTFIKMDIEGAELAALRGCADTIREYKPKLAICVYHKPEDIFEIPEYILSLNPDYKMWLRHYTNLINETVLYCE